MAQRTSSIAVHRKGADSIRDGILAFQANSFYLVEGTDFGSDVTACAASAGEDAQSY